MTLGTTAAEMLRKHIGRKADLLPLTMLMEIGEAMIEYGQQCADAEAAAMRERAAAHLEARADMVDPPGKRVPMVDQHTASVLRSNAAAIRALPATGEE